MPLCTFWTKFCLGPINKQVRYGWVHVYEREGRPVGSSSRVCVSRVWWDKSLLSLLWWLPAIWETLLGVDRLCVFVCLCMFVLAFVSNKLMTPSCHMDGCSVLKCCARVYVILVHMWQAELQYCHNSEQSVCELYVPRLSLWLSIKVVMTPE